MTLPPMSEADFSSQVEDLLELGGWLWEHPRPARIKVGGKETYRTAISGHKGRPDYLAVRGRVIFFELKAEKGKLSSEQAQWIEALDEANAEVYLFRPSQIDDVVKLLTGRHS